MDRVRGNHRWRLVAVLAAAGILAVACGGDGDDQTTGGSLVADESETDGTETGETSAEERVEPSYGGSITVALEAESNTWTPGPAQIANAGMMVAMAIYDPLLAQSGDGELRPVLAESIEPNDDLTQWTLTLRDGVQFHDGTPLDAETLKWNFDTLHFVDTSQSYGSLQQAGVTGMDVADDMTVVYNLSSPNAAFPDLLTLEAGWPISRQAYEADPEGFGDNPVGTGPFVMQEWNRDDRTVVTRNPNYWRTDENGDQLPYLDEIVFRPITDEDSRVQSLAAGDAQVMQTLRGSTVKQVLDLAEDPDFETSVFLGNNSGGAILNVLEPPVDDVRIRRALAMAIDVHSVQVVLGDDGLTEPSTGLFSPDSPWYSETAAAAYPGAEGRDLDGARALVEEYRDDPDRSDGKAPGADIVVEFSCPADPSLIEVSQLTQSLWQEAGVVTELRQVEQAVHITNAIGSADTEPPLRGDFVVNCWRMGAERDPLTSLQNAFGPIAETPGNVTNYTDPEIDEQLEILRTNADFEARYAAVERIGVIVGEQAPYLWFSPTPSIVGYTADLHGLEDWTLPDGSPGRGTPGAVGFFHQAFLAN